MKTNSHTNVPDDSLSTDDMDMLQQVLEHVRGAFPDEPYRQAEFTPEDFEEVA